MNLTPKNIKKPLRMVLNSIYNSTAGKAKGLCFSGKIESGVLEKGGKYVVMPACGQITVKGWINFQLLLKKNRHFH